ncbi:MAG: hypothetical protein AAF125_06575 [Chloroflexota bacterium]
MQKTLQLETANAPKRLSPRGISAGVSVTVILLIGIYYLHSVREALFSASVSAASFRFLMNIVIAIVFVEVITPAVTFLSRDGNAKDPEREALITLRATRNAHLILSTGVILGFELASMPMTAFQMANVLLLVFILSEMVKYGTRMLFYLWPGLGSQDV